MKKISIRKFKELISILMESSLYSTLSSREKKALVSTLADKYPFLVNEKDEEVPLGYESSLRGIIKTHVR